MDAPANDALSIHYLHKGTAMGLPTASVLAAVFGPIPLGVER
jgi:hypothetical protein